MRQRRADAWLVVFSIVLLVLLLCACAERLASQWPLGDALAAPQLFAGDAVADAALARAI